MTHTPTPWEIAHYEDGILEGLNFIRGGDRAHICSIVRLDARAAKDAAFIVKACNAYEELLPALKDLVSVCEGTGRQPPCIEKARAAIAKAEAKS